MYAHVCHAWYRKCFPALIPACRSLYLLSCINRCFISTFFSSSSAFKRVRARRSAVSRIFWPRRSTTLGHWRQRRLTARLKKEIRQQKAHAFCKVPCTRLSRLNAARPQALQCGCLFQSHRNKRQFENGCAWQPCTHTPKHQAKKKQRIANLSIAHITCRHNPHQIYVLEQSLLHNCKICCTGSKPRSNWIFLKQTSGQSI